MGKHILTLHHHGGLGGAERSWLIWIKQCLDAGHRVSVGLPTSSGVLASELRELGAVVYAVAVGDIVQSKRPWVLWRYWSRRKQLIRDVSALHAADPIEILHANSLKSAVQLGGPLKQLPCGLWVHLRDFIALNGVTSRLLSGWSSLTTIVISQAIKSYYADQLPEGTRCEVIPNAMALPIAEGARPETAHTTIGMIGQWVEWKNHHGFLHMAKILHDKDPDLRFVIAGGEVRPGQRKYHTRVVHAAESMGLQDVIQWEPHAVDMLAVIRQWHVMVLPSRREPFGRCVVEGMASGVPVVACAGSGPDDIIVHGYSGLLVAPDDPGALAKAVGDLLEHPDQHAMLAEGGRSRLAAHFTPEKIWPTWQSLGGL